MEKKEKIKHFLEDIQAVLTETNVNKNESEVTRAFRIGEGINSAVEGGLGTEEIVEEIVENFDISKRSVYNYLTLHDNIADKYGNLEKLFANHPDQKAISLNGLYIFFKMKQPVRREKRITIPVRVLNKIKKNFTTKNQKSRELIENIFTAIEDWREYD